MTKILHLDSFNIEYGQFYFDVSDDDEDGVFLDPDGAFTGQVNGLCGGAQRGKVFFVAGINVGKINISIELLSEKPDIEEGFEDIVEISFVKGYKPIFLCDNTHDIEEKIEIPRGIYRLRYCLSGMDIEYADEQSCETTIEGQKYLIQLWEEEKKKDEIIKVTSNSAKYWHEENSDLDGEEYLDLEGVNIVFTGKMEKGTRNDMEEIAEDQGANVQKSVNGKTDILVVGERVGEKKLQKANELRIEVITEEDFLSLVDEE